MNKRLYRYEIPGKYDQLPYGAEIVRLQSHIYDSSIIYKQISRDQNNPHWEPVGMITDVITACPS